MAPQMFGQNAKVDICGGIYCGYTDVCVCVLFLWWCVWGVDVEVAGEGRWWWLMLSSGAERGRDGIL